MLFAIVMEETIKLLLTSKRVYIFNCLSYFIVVILIILTYSSLFSLSCKRRFSVFNCCWRPPGSTRWWAELELLIFLRENFENLAVFCATAVVDGDMERSTRMQRLKDTMADDVTRSCLKFELGVVCIVGKCMIEATHYLEGDFCGSLVTYSTIQDCADWLNENYEELTFPGMAEVIDDCVSTLLGEDEEYDSMNPVELRDYMKIKAKNILKGGVKYFNHTIMGKLSDDLEIYKTCRYANPVWMRDVFGDRNLPRDFAAAITNLGRFPKRKIDNMVDELIKYKREVADFRRADDEGLFTVQMERCATFWLQAHATLPHLASFARYCLTLAPSSAAAERVFSYLKILSLSVR